MAKPRDPFVPTSQPTVPSHPELILRFLHINSLITQSEETLCPLLLELHHELSPYVQHARPSNPYSDGINFHDVETRMRGPASRILADWVRRKYRILGPVALHDELSRYLAEQGLYLVYLNLLRPLVPIEGDLKRLRGAIPGSRGWESREEGAAPIALRLGESQCVELYWREDGSRYVLRPEKRWEELVRDECLARVQMCMDLFACVKSLVPMLLSFQLRLADFADRVVLVAADYGLGWHDYDEDKHVEVMSGALDGVVRAHSDRDLLEHRGEDLLLLCAWEEIVQIMQIKRLVDALMADDG